MNINYQAASLKLYAAPRQSGKANPQERRALRDKCQRERGAVETIPAVAGSLVSSIAGFVFGLFATTPARRNPMCDNYGHIIENNWSGLHPHCTDCGIAVVDASMLRKATPR